MKRAIQFLIVALVASLPFVYAASHSGETWNTVETLHTYEGGIHFVTFTNCQVGTTIDFTRDSLQIVALRQQIKSVR